MTVRAYETHALCALKAGDISELKQCLFALKGLHHDLPDQSPNSVEFHAYRLMFYALEHDETQLSKELLILTPHLRTQAPIQHALK